MGPLCLNSKTALHWFYKKSTAGSQTHTDISRVQEVLLSRDESAEEVDIGPTSHIDDGYRLLAFKQIETREIGCFNTNCSINISQDLTDHMYPLTPVVWASGVVASASNSSQLRPFLLDSKPSSVCFSDQTVDIAEFYPEFQESDMQLNMPLSSNRKWFQRLGRCCITPPRPSPTRTSCSKRIDPVTTLHVMLGDDK